MLGVMEHPCDQAALRTADTSTLVELRWTRVSTGGWAVRTSMSLSPCRSHPQQGGLPFWDAKHSVSNRLLATFAGMEARNGTCAGDPDPTPLILVPVHPGSASGVPHLTRAAAHR